MACVTMKRPLEFDPIYPHGSPPHSSNCSPRPHKRRRLLPMSVLSTQVQGQPQMASTSNVTVGTSNSQQQIVNKRKNVQSRFVENVAATLVSPPSAFTKATPVLSRDEITQYVKEEIRRLRRQRLLQSSPEHKPMDEDSSVGAAFPASSSSYIPTASGHRSTISPSKDSPIFSLRQVVNLCEKVLKEQDKEVCKEYEEELIERKNEQYHSFVKFNEDHLQSSAQIHERPTYLS